MHPRLISTPYFTLHMFGVLLALVFVAAMWWVAASPITKLSQAERK